MALPIGGCTSAKFGAQLLSVLSRAKLAGDDSAVVWQEADRMVPLDNNTSVVLNVIDAVGNTLCVHAGEDTLERWFGC